jgi:hypothetical protein
MKKFSILIALALMLVSVSVTFADLEFEDPALCVNGEWLVIDAAKSSAVKVTVPRGAHYGNQREGRCRTPAPAPVLPKSSVTERGNGHLMFVEINGRGASKPTVTASYAGVTFVKQNHGGMIKFKFQLDH